MPRILLDDTIAAIGTPIGEGGIGIVRISGKEACSIADKIFISKNRGKPSGYEAYTTHYGWIIDGGEIIDEVILTVMRAPKSYTKEDVVEINCHGGIVPIKKVLELALSAGARLAERGEFTKRAFLNGRIDLAQAEAVLDVIRAKTKKGLEIALLQLEGELSRFINDLKRELVDIKINLEASVDFPDESLSVYSCEEIKARLDSMKDKLNNFVKSFESGKIVREGINCVICGKPNTGKSSLMNLLLNEERVIVTPVPGTTRDAICEYINIDGIPFQIIDTAGIAKTTDIIEREGIIRSKIYIEKADLILFMMDASTGFSEKDEEIIELVKDKEVICIVNKIDLPKCIDIGPSDIIEYFGKEISFLEISVLRKTNIDKLLSCITDTIWKGKVFASDNHILTNARHRDALSKTLGFVKEAIFSLNEGRTEEIIALSIDEANRSLGEIIGESVSQDILDRIFEQFCIGK